MIERANSGPPENVDRLLEQDIDPAWTPPAEVRRAEPLPPLGLQNLPLEERCDELAHLCLDLLTREKFRGCKISEVATIFRMCIDTAQLLRNRPTRINGDMTVDEREARMEELRRLMAERRRLALGDTGGDRAANEEGE